MLEMIQHALAVAEAGIDSVWYAFANFCRAYLPVPTMAVFLLGLLWAIMTLRFNRHE